MCHIFTLTIPWVAQKKLKFIYFPPTWVITMLLQMENIALIIFFSIDKALNSCSHMPYVVWKGIHLLIAYIWSSVKFVTDKMQS